jgi:cell division protein FtsI/penicillin-binding protein 2
MVRGRQNEGRISIEFVIMSKSSSEALRRGKINVTNHQKKNRKNRNEAVDVYRVGGKNGIYILAE